MRIATWNVNSVRARLPRLLPWLVERQPDVVCLQEIKVVDEDFPRAEIEALGYRAEVFGQKTYNGVAILSRGEATDVVRGLPGDGPEADKRLLAATVGGVRVIGVYCPNGGEVGSDKYAFKLDWFARLQAFLEASVRPEAPAVLCGDINVAPGDEDVWDPARWRDQILCSEPERAAFRGLLGCGFVDALRLRHQEGGIYTWWDYRMGAFHRGWGLRIDHVLASRGLAPRCVEVAVDRDARKGDKPSDHAPVIATFDL
jgi:exodeoxyribonuclease III